MEGSKESVKVWEWKSKGPFCDEKEKVKLLREVKEKSSHQHGTTICPQKGDKCGQKSSLWNTKYPQMNYKEMTSSKREDDFADERSWE